MTPHPYRIATPDSPTRAPFGVRGFTLIDILVGVVLLGILAALLAPNVLPLNPAAEVAKPRRVASERPYM